MMSKRNRNKGDEKQVVFSPAIDKDGYLARMAMEQAGMIEKEDTNDVSSVDLDQQVEAIESGGNCIKQNMRISQDDEDSQNAKRTMDRNR